MIVYGVKIESDIAFPFVLPEDSFCRSGVKLSSHPPLSLKKGAACGFPFYAAHGRKVYLYSDRVFDGNETGQPWCYDVLGVVRFYWVSGERQIYYELGEDGTVELLGFWFVHLFLPLYCTLEGLADFLHAGSVALEGKPILFIAPSMGGKSTLVDYCLKQGAALVADDKVSTFIEGGRFMVSGSHPYHRPYREFEVLGDYADHFERECKPIHAFYALEPCGADGDICINEVKGVQKFEILCPNYLYTFPFLMEQRLLYFSRMVDNTRMFTLQRPWDMSRQSAVYTAIYEHSCSLS